MFFLSLASPDSGAYVEQAICRLAEEFHTERFVAAWQQLCKAEPILRTCFLWDGEHACQFEVESAEIPVSVVDWSTLSLEEQDANLESFLAEDRRLGFNMACAPLMRLSIFRCANGSHLVVWTVHHIIVDGHTIQLLLRQAFEIYATRSAGEVPPSRRAPTFRRYVDQIGRIPTEPAEAFWRDYLSGMEAASDLPLPGRAQHRGPIPAFDQMRRRLNLEATTALEAFAAGNDLTENIVLMGAWLLLLHRYTEMGDIVLGAVKSVRNCPAVSELTAGPLINTLPFRSRLSGDDRVVPWLQALRTQWIRLREHEHASPAQIRSWSGIDGDVPLHEAYFVYSRLSLHSALNGLGGEWEHRKFQLREHTPVPLILATYGGESLELIVEYDTARFDPAPISRMMDHLITVLGGMLDEPDGRLVTLPLLTPEESSYLLSGPTPATREGTTTFLHEMAERFAQETPDTEAVEFDGQVLTYGELNILANQLARYLQELKVGPEVCVGVCMPRSTDWIVSLLAILKAGGTYVPLDPAYPTERLEYMLADCNAAVLLKSSSVSHNIGTAPVQTILLDTMTNWLAERPAENLPPPSPDTQAYIIYTSGSTGRPKGVSVAHREAAWHVATACDLYGINAADRLLQFSSLSFDLTIEKIFTTFAAGAMFVIAEPRAYDPVEYSAVLAEHRITMTNLPPAFWQQWTEEVVERGCDGFGAQFRFLMVGADVVPMATLRKWLSNPRAAAVRFFNVYGPTEAVITATYFEVPPGFGTEEAVSRVPIGKPFPGTELLVLDQHRNPVPVGLPGELYIGGNRLARGYHNRPELTAERFIAHPFNKTPGARLYRTGDRVRLLEDGNIDFLGRADNQIKIRGFRIELGEIETALRAAAGIHAAVVRLHKGPSYDPELVAYIVPDGGTVLKPAELRQILRCSLPEYMVPARFVLMDEFPVNVNGKVDVKALPTPEDRAVTASGDRLKPRNEAERKIAQAWKNVLGHGQFGVQDNFFDVGGHSLRAAQVVAHLRTAHQAEVSLGSFLLSPTIEGLANAIVSEVGDSGPAVANGVDPCIEVLKATGTRPPLFCALGAGGAAYSYGPLANHMDADQPVYGLQYTRVPGCEHLADVGPVAERYITAIRSVQPSGPYYLAGWSFGGLVAYEIACLLKEAGESVGLLAVIDCEARIPHTRTNGRRLNSLYMGVRQLGKRAKILFQTREAALAYTCDLARLSWTSAVLRRNTAVSVADYLHFARNDLLRIYALKQAGTELEDAGRTRLGLVADDFVRSVVAGTRANENAGKRYSMRRYDGKVTLFRTADTPGEYSSRDQALGYRNVAHDVDVVVVEGSHLMLIREPYVQRLALAIAASLATAQKVTM